MKNDVMNLPFPDNLFTDLGKMQPVQQAEDFIGTLMYVLRTVASARDARVVMMRYQSGKSFEEIGESIGVSKQRANAMLTDTLGKITGEHVNMLTKGMKRYMEDLLDERIAELGNVLEDSERESIRTTSYKEGYERGYADANAKRGSNPVNHNAVNNVEVKTLGLSTRTYNACTKNGMETIGDIIRRGDAITECKSFGVTCFHELIKKLESFGIDALTTFPLASSKYGVEVIAK